MTAARIVEALRRRVVDVVLLGGLVVGFVLLVAFFPWYTAVGLWGFLLVPAFVHATVHDTGDEADS